MNPTLPVLNPRPATLAAPGLVIVIRRGPGDPVLARERVLRGDLTDAAGEFWRDLCLGRGNPDCRPADLGLQVEPIPNGSATAGYRGFALLAGPDSLPAGRNRLEFSTRALEPAARRAEARLASAGTLKSGDKCYFEIEADPDPVDPAAGFDLDFDATVECRPLHLLEVPLAPLLETAHVVGPDPAGFFPVFYTRHVLARAEEFSRKGATVNPSFESGGVLAGVLCRCPDSAAFFVVVTDVFEVTDAEASLVSLEYSGKSWSRIQTVIRARRQSEPAIELTGQCHGHNFLPNEGKTCDGCASREVCTLNNVFASADDSQWTRSVFAGAPWCLCHIFGLSARGDLLQGLFTLHDARLQQRGFHVLPDFASGGHPVKTIAR